MTNEAAVREAVRREVEPLLVQCAAMVARLDRLESALPEISDRHERAAARVDLILRRANLNAVVSGLQGTEERVLRLAKERWPWLA
jgi:hypothetical protein